MRPLPGLPPQRPGGSLSAVRLLSKVVCLSPNLWLQTGDDEAMAVFSGYHLRLDFFA